IPRGLRSRSRCCALSDSRPFPGYRPPAGWLPPASFARRWTGSQPSGPSLRRCVSVTCSSRAICSSCVCPPAPKTFGGGNGGQFFEIKRRSANGNTRASLCERANDESKLPFSGSHFALQTSCWFQNCRLWRINSFARADALFEESLLHWTARQRQRRAEVLARRVISPAAQLKLPKRRRVKRIAREAIAVLDRTDRVESALRTFVLRDRNGAVKRHHRRRPHRHQRAVE